VKNLNVVVNLFRQTKLRQIKENSNPFLISKHTLAFSLRVEVINCKDLEDDDFWITIYVRLNGEQVINKLMS
jgi:hypothetical protein